MAEKMPKSDFLQVHPAFEIMAHFKDLIPPCN
jgi:hypothetical protein